ncbi:hypothetical protein NW53_11320 [Listeria monocytogenes]|nr:hypothetical protein [Listeria monocytogenes]
MFQDVMVKQKVLETYSPEKNKDLMNKSNYLSNKFLGNPNMLLRYKETITNLIKTHFKRLLAFSML